MICLSVLGGGPSVRVTAMLNRKIASAVFASRKSLELGNGGTLSGACAALVNMAHGSSAPVRHTHPRFIQNATHGVSPSVAAVCPPYRSFIPCGIAGDLRPTAASASKRSGSVQARTFGGGEREFVRGCAPGSWRSPLLIIGRGLERLVVRLANAAAGPRLALIPAAGTQRLAPRFARAWVFSS